MNSEVYNDIQTQEQQRLEAEKEKLKLKEGNIVIDSQKIENMLQTEGWKKISQDLDLLQTGLLNKLRHEKGLSKYNMDRIIDQMNNIEIFKTLPMKYIERVKMLIKRKVKGE